MTKPYNELIQRQSTIKSLLDVLEAEEKAQAELLKNGAGAAYDILRKDSDHLREVALACAAHDWEAIQKWYDKNRTPW